MKASLRESLLAAGLMIGVAIGLLVAEIKPGGVYEAPLQELEHRGKTYAASIIRTMTIEGLRLGLTEEAALKILKAHHWEGHWHPFTDPQIDFPFRRDKELI